MVEIPEQIKDKARFILVQKKGKVAVEKDWQNTNNYEYDNPKLQDWIKNGGNYGVLPKSNLCILDVDEPDKIGDILQIFKNTFTVKTSKGYHFYIEVPNNENGKKIPFYDKKTKEHLGEFYVNGCNGYCVGATSVHPNGSVYTVLNDTSIKTYSIEELNTTFFSSVLTNKKTDTTPMPKIDTQTKVDWVNKAKKGERNSRLTQMAGNLLFKQKLPLDVVLLTLQEWNKVNCEPPLEHPEVETIVNSIYKMEINNTNRYEAFTELGNAKKLVTEYKNKILFDTQKNKWLFWNGKKWEYDELLDIERKFFNLLEKMKKDLPIDDEKLLNKYLAHINKSQSRSSIQGSLKHARALVPVSNDKLNRNPFLFNMQNGILDLKNDTLHQHDQQFMLTQIAPVNYDYTKTCPMWLDFLNKIFKGNQNIIEFIQRALGYSLSGSTTERCIFILYGSGKNGKTVFLETISRIIFGEYARKTNSETFMKQTNSGLIRNDLARLQGARFVYASEGNESRKLDEGVVKEITGGDNISARYLYSEWFEFKPEFKVWFATNHKPTITGSDNAVWRRIKLIPFTVTIKDSEEIPQDILFKCFEDEKEGIFKWIYDGFLKWHNEGFNNCPEIDDEVKSYREEMDYIENFVQDCCLLDGTSVTPTKWLYEAFIDWWTEEELSSYKPISKKAFSMKLQDRGLERVSFRKDDGIFRGFKGITLRS